jgi:D-amino-acid oxidase
MTTHISEGSVTEALVIGAGVSGLTTALCLAEAGHAVRIRTAAVPRETTSRAAGAMWGSTFAGPADKVEGWASASLAAFRDLARDPGSGVAFMSGTLASTGGGAPPPQMFPGVEIHRSAPPTGYAAGFRVTLPLIDMPRYLDHLAGRVEAAGIPIEVRAVESFAEAAGEAPVVVNCAGVGARDLVPDPALRSVRGQHVVVENPGLDEFFMTEPLGPAWTSLFPHGERLILGSVAQEDDWDTAPRGADADAILERAAAVDPRVRDAQILEHQVGLRPVRDVVRVEAQTLAGARLVHNYGHGGTGVGLSWGCARDVVALVAAERGPLRC